MSSGIGEAFEALVEVVGRLRDPDGCPWDRKQDHKSLRKYVIEEAYEVVDAIDKSSSSKLEEELGDLMLQTILHARIADEEKRFDIASVCDVIRAKLVRRHPHVFGETEVSGVDDVLHNWEEIKSREPGNAEIKSAIGGVPKSLPALMLAAKISKRAARTGFEWPDISAVFDKLREEIAELEQAVEADEADSIKSEIGDVLFTVVNIARWCDVDAEESLREMVERFETRFAAIEDHARKTGRDLGELTLNEMDEVWNRAKSAD